MAALSAAVKREFVGDQDEISILLADSDTYYEGAMLVPSSGKGAVASAAAENAPILGILGTEYSDGDRTSAKVIGSSNTVKAIRAKRGKVWLPHSGAAQTDVGGLFLPANDNDMSDVPTTADKRYIGYVALDFKTGHLLFDIRNPVCVDNET